MFTEQDKVQIASQGISEEKIEQQIQHFIDGFPFLNVIRAATIGDGIVRVDEEQLPTYTRRYDEVAGNYTLMPSRKVFTRSSGSNDSK